MILWVVHERRVFIVDWRRVFPRHDNLGEECAECEPGRSPAVWWECSHESFLKYGIYTRQGEG